MRGIPQARVAGGREAAGLPLQRVDQWAAAAASGGHARALAHAACANNAMV